MPARTRTSSTASTAGTAPGLRRIAVGAVLLCVAALTSLGVAPTSQAQAPVASVAASTVGTTANNAAGTGTTPPVSAGGEFSCGLRTGGTLWCWGRNTYGQLGNGTMGTGSATPTQVGKLGGWTRVSAGGSTTCAIRTSHGLFCWGLDHRGQLGDGSTHAVATPKAVPGPMNWAQVATGWFHTCGIRTDHSLWCWGDNSAGQLGQGTTKHDLKLHQVPGTWKSVSVAGWDTCGIKTNGSLWCWGRNLFGQLGISSFTDQSRPTQVGASTTWTQVALSWTHTCGLQANGIAKCWGRNDQGQVGTTTALYVNHPTTVPGSHVATSVAVAEGTSCLVDTVGAAWCWGDNRYGQVSARAPATPGARTPVSRGGAFSTVSGGWFHVCAATTTGVPTCWGDDAWGQLGADAPTVPLPVANRPVTKTADGPLTLRLASFNTLGNHHTQPGRDADNYAPSRVRADWEAQSILNQGIQVAGIEEQDAGQLGNILTAAGGDLASFPTPAAGDIGVETAVVWDTRYYKAVATQTIRLPFIAREIKRPVVKLEQLSTGRDFWVMAVHNAPNTQQAKRNVEVAQEIARLNQLQRSNLPVFFVGDFNEKATLLCKVLKGTDLSSASGGRVQGNGKCLPPKGMRVDWIFGTKSQVTWSGFSFTKPPLVRLSTDHHVPVVDVTVP